MKINLNQLAAELAKSDNPKGRNEDVIAAKTILAALGRKLRSVDGATATQIVAAIATRAGMVILALWLAAGSLQAQDTNPSPPPSPVGLGDLGGTFLAYLHANASIGSGYGSDLRFKPTDRGVLLVESLDTPVTFELGKAQFTLAVAHETLFTQPVNHQYLALALPTTIYRTPPWVVKATTIPGIPTPVGTITPATIQPKFSEIFIEPTLGIRVEDAYNVKVHWKRLCVGIQASVKF